MKYVKKIKDSFKKNTADIIYTITCLIASLTLGYYSNNILHNMFKHSENYALKTKEKAAILISSDVGILMNYLFFRGPSMIEGYFTRNNIKTKWFLSPNIETLEKVLNSEEYQSIVTIGHSNSIETDLGNINVDQDLVDRLFHGKKKKGVWIQLGCGADCVQPLGLNVMTNQQNILYKKKPVSAFEIFSEGISKESFN